LCGLVLFMALKHGDRPTQRILAEVLRTWEGKFSDSDIKARARPLLS
jgi:hypothetical protein